MSAAAGYAALVGIIALGTNREAGSVLADLRGDTATR